MGGNGDGRRRYDGYRPACHRDRGFRCGATGGPFVIDPTGRAILGEAEHIRVLGPAARVEMPSGVRAWAVSDQGLPRPGLAGWHGGRSGGKGSPLAQSSEEGFLRDLLRTFHLQETQCT